MAFLRAGSSLLRLRLFLMMLVLPLSHPIAHIPKLLPHVARRPENGHQEVEHKLVQQIENNDQK